MPHERGKLQFRSSLLLSDRAEYYMIFLGKLETQILPKNAQKEETQSIWKWDLGYSF